MQLTTNLQNPVQYSALQVDWDSEGLLKYVYYLDWVVTTGTSKVLLQSTAYITHNFFFISHFSHHSFAPPPNLGCFFPEGWQEVEKGKSNILLADSLIIDPPLPTLQRRTASTDKMVKAASPPNKKKKSNVRRIK